MGATTGWLFKNISYADSKSGHFKILKILGSGFLMIIKHSSTHGHMGLWGENGQPLKILKIGEDDLVLNPEPNKFDAMLCWGEFTDEFLEYRGARVFYCCEPSFFFQGWRWAKLELRKKLGTLREDEFAWHYHPHPQMRVEHETSTFPDSRLLFSTQRIRGAAAVVGNLGHPVFRNSGRKKRLEFILASGCDIYGPRSNWERFRLSAFSKKALPVNYIGECPYPQKIEVLSKYQVAICLENSSEPLYFTEKFPDAVRAGCIPIYHAHPSVRTEFLNGAVWVDPAQYEFDAPATMEAALAKNRAEVAETNRKWMRESGILERAGLFPIYSKLAAILRAKIDGSFNLPLKASRPNLKDEYGKI